MYFFKFYIEHVNKLDLHEYVNKMLVVFTEMYK